MTPDLPSVPRATPTMNVTPLLDILLVVFIIYILLVFWRFSLPVQLPVNAPPGAGPAAPAIVLQVLSDGSYQVNRTPVPARRIEPFLRKIIREHPGSPVYVSADPDRVYQDVIRAMDLAKGAGAAVLSLGP